MLLNGIRFVKGTVRFRVTGKSPERLLNLAAQRGVLLWNVQPTAQGMEGETAAGDYRRLRPLARLAGVRTKVLRKHGAPFWAAKYRGRFGLLIGAVLGAALLVFLSQFLWTIDIVGQEHVSEARLRSLLAESGVCQGAYRYGIDTAQARRDLLLRVDELSWLSVNIVGCHATVEIKEKAEKPDLDSAVPCNLKAKTDGVITKVTVGEGVTQVKTGSGVAKGDLLVSGVALSAQNTVRYVRAKGEVLADVYSTKELKLPKTVDYISLSENKAERTELRFLNLRLPCTLSFKHFSKAACTETADWLTVNQTALPLGFVTQTAHELHTAQRPLDGDTAKRAFSQSLLLYELFEKGGSRRLDKRTSVEATAEGYTCSAHYVFNENIAESVDFSVEEGYNNSYSNENGDAQ